jgi:hypothetical protein
MDRDSEAPFFVGYLHVPPGLGLFLFAVGGFLIGGFVALAVLIGSSQDDPGNGDFKWGWGQQTIIGRLEALPYPVLHVTKGTDRIAKNRAVLLSGVGKKGVQQRFAKLDGQMVQLKGIALKRGDLDGLQVNDGDEAIVSLDGAAMAEDRVDLGRWKLKGEICDGKCLAGAMRPGRGLSHRACANLCLIGGAPPVFVTEGNVDGVSYFLIADAEGKPLPDIYLKYVALLISIEGMVERRGNLMVFKAQLDTLKVL